MRRLFPEIDQLLELHAPLGIEHVVDSEVLLEPVALKLLSDLGPDAGNRHVQLVELDKDRCLAEILPVKLEDALTQVLCSKGSPRGFRKGRRERGHCAILWSLSMGSGGVSLASGGTDWCGEGVWQLRGDIARNRSELTFSQLSAARDPR